MYSTVYYRGPLLCVGCLFVDLRVRPFSRACEYYSGVFKQLITGIEVKDRALNIVV